MNNTYTKGNHPNYFKVEHEPEFIDWASQIRLAIYDKCKDPTRIKDITPEYFQEETPATVGNPNPKKKLITKIK